MPNSVTIKASAAGGVLIGTHAFLAFGNMLGVRWGAAVRTQDMHVQQAALFCPEGSVLVNVPHPARYALHKLLVYGESTGTFGAKAPKDLAQAAHILAWLNPAERRKSRKHGPI